MTGVKKEEETVAIVQLFLDGEFEQLQDLYRRVHDVTISEIDEECVATPIIKELIDLDPTKRPRADEVVKKLESLFHDRYK